MSNSISHHQQKILRKIIRPFALIRLTVVLRKLRLKKINNSVSISVTFEGVTGSKKALDAELKKTGQFSRVCHLLAV